MLIFMKVTFLGVLILRAPLKLFFSLDFNTYASKL